MIHLQHVYKTYNSGLNYVIEDISLEVAQGEILVLLGSSGSGKTTLLKMINRLVEPTHGEIFFQNKPIQDFPIEELRHAMGYVFQQIGLFPHMTVTQNVSTVLHLQKVSKEECRQRADELLKLINLDPYKFSHRFPDELSGGQQQRVGVARALAADPAVLLMDEPFGALDALTRESLQNETIRLRDELNKTILFVTHDIQEAFRLADRIAVLHQGHLQQVSTPEELKQNPATEFVAQLLEQYGRQE